MTRMTCMTCMTCMTPPRSPEALERLAHKRAGAKLGWYVHAAFFVLVNLLMFVLARMGFDHWSWSVVPFLGWGVSLALHGVSVFVLGSGNGLRQRLAQKERERLQRGQDAP